MNSGGLLPRRRRRRLPLRLLALASLALALAAGWVALSAGGGDLRASVPARVTPARVTPAPRPLPAPVPQLAVPAPEIAAGPAGIRLGGVDTFALRFRKPPGAGLVFDVETGEVLWRHAAERVLPMASLTKMMTALIVAEETSSRERVRIPRAALRYRGSAVGRLPRGRHVPIEALLHGLLLPSGNDAAIALAVHVAGSEPAFVRMMNQRGRALGLRCTRFVSSHGLERGNRSCVADLAALARADLREYRIRRVARKREAALRFPIRGGRLFLTSTNPLLRTGYPGAIGLKTGYTVAAGRCLVGVAERGGRTLGVVLLRSPDTNRQARKLLTTGFRRG